MAPGSPVSLGTSFYPVTAALSTVTAFVLAQCPAPAPCGCSPLPSLGWVRHQVCIPSQQLCPSQKVQKDSKGLGGPPGWGNPLCHRALGQNSLRWAGTAPVHTQSTHTEPEPCSCPSRASILNCVCIIHFQPRSNSCPCAAPTLRHHPSLTGLEKPQPTTAQPESLQSCQARTSTMRSWRLSGISCPPCAPHRLGRLLIMLELLDRGALGRAFQATELRKLSR